MNWSELFNSKFSLLIGSSIGAVVLSIAANLLTPWVERLSVKHVNRLRFRKLDKRIRRRREIILLQQNISRQMLVKLDAIFNVGCGFILITWAISLLEQAGSGNVFDSPPPWALPEPLNEICLLTLAFMTCVLGLVVLRRGGNFMVATRLAGNREQAVNEFFDKVILFSDKEVETFYEDWDLKHFGVNSQSDPKPVPLIMPGVTPLK